MFKDAKKRIMLAVLAALALGNAISAAAATPGANQANYSGYVTKSSDLRTSELQKVSKKDNGTNIVRTIDDGSWCSWILNWNGSQVTEKANYSGAGTYYMSFTHEADVDSNQTAHLKTSLVISTRWYEFDSTFCTGVWSPDTL